MVNDSFLLAKYGEQQMHTESSNRQRYNTDSWYAKFKQNEITKITPMGFLPQRWIYIGKNRIILIENYGKSKYLFPKLS